MAESGDQKLSGGVEGEREEEGEGGGGEGRQEEGRKKSEEEVYTLLFREVDSGGEGVVSVRSLVDYLQQMQLGTPQTRLAGAEEVYDSHEDVGCLTHTLMAALSHTHTHTGPAGPVQPPAAQGNARGGTNTLCHCTVTSHTITITSHTPSPSGQWFRWGRRSSHLLSRYPTVGERCS